MSTWNGVRQALCDKARDRVLSAGGYLHIEYLGSDMRLVPLPLFRKRRRGCYCMCYNLHTNDDALVARGVFYIIHLYNMMRSA